MSRRRWALVLAVLVASAGVLAWVPVLDVDGDGLSVLHESRLGTDPLAGDSDDDGLADDAELEVDTDPLDPDTDGDDLEDGEEVHDRLDPTSADTDDDGLEDGEEVQIYGSDPRNDSPALSVTPTSLNFVGADGGPVRATVVVENGEDADGPVRVNGTAIVGRDAAAYTIISGAGPVTLNPGESHEIVVRYEDPPDEGDNYATLQLFTDAETQPQVDVWLADTETTVAFETTRAPDRTSVEMTIGAAQAGSTVAMNLSRPGTRDAVAGIDALGIRVAEDSDLRLNVTSAADPLPGMAAFDVGNNTTAIGHFRVEHTIGESEVDSGWFRFRLAKSRFAANNTRPEHVVLYRYVDGEWHELETRVVGETETHWLFRAETPGFSDFTAGVKQPKFEVTEANVDVDRVDAGDAVTVRVRITNTGEADGRFTAKLVLNGEVVDAKTATIAVNGTRQVTFERVFDDPGEYEVRVNGVLADEVVVESETDDGSPAGAVGFDSVLLGGGLLGILVFLVSGVVLWRRRGPNAVVPDGDQDGPGDDDIAIERSGDEPDDPVFRERAADERPADPDDANVRDDRVDTIDRTATDDQPDATDRTEPDDGTDATDRAEPDDRTDATGPGDPADSTEE